MTIHLPTRALRDILRDGLFIDGDWVESKDQDPNGQVRLTQLADVGETAWRDRSDRWMNDEQARRLGVTYLRPGDVLVARMPDPLGRACLVPETIGRAATVVDVAILRPSPQSVDRRYLMYAINSHPVRSQIELLQAGATRQRVSRKNLGGVQIPFPSPAEQRAIADYLDHETAQIDKLVAKQEELIRHLEDRRVAFIASTALTGLQREKGGGHDVTRWGNSLAVEPWLRRAPASWGLARFKTICLPRAERNVTGAELMLSLTVKGQLIDRSTVAVQQNASDGSIPRYFVARANDLVVNPMWLTGGAIGVSDKRGAVSPDYRVFEIAKHLNPWYLHAVLRSAPYFDQYRLYTRSNTTFDRRIKQNDLDNLPVPIPPIDEQIAIVDYINGQTAQIDVLIAKTHEHIALAKERRSALVTAAVSGQIDSHRARKAS
ncbi:MAG: hypothetical protein K0S70_786 [Microbacterium sp.]|nr:hypothetical protein [Microbacterium sp.]